MVCVGCLPPTAQLEPGRNLESVAPPALRKGEILDLVRPRDVVILHDASDLLALGEAIIAVLDNPGAAARTDQAAGRRVIDEYLVHRYVTRDLRLIKTVAG